MGPETVRLLSEIRLILEGMTDSQERRTVARAQGLNRKAMSATIRSKDPEDDSKVRRLWVKAAQANSRAANAADRVGDRKTARYHQRVSMDWSDKISVSSHKERQSRARERWASYRKGARS